MNFFSGQQFIIELYEKYATGKSDKEIMEWWKLQTYGLNGIPNENQIKILRPDYENAFKNDRASKAVKLQEWFESNPNLPKPSLGIIHKFLWTSKDNEEQCKKIMMRYYSLRGADDEIFGDRDPCSLEAVEVNQHSCFVCLPVMTDNMYRINLSMLTNYDPNKFDPLHWVRRILYIADLRIRDDYCLGEIMIYDLKGLTLQHLTKFSLSLTKKMLIATEGALPAKIKQVHFVNCPVFMDKITALFKPLLKEKLAKRIHIHTNSMDTLYEFIPKNYLPQEFGGTLPSIKTFHDAWVKQIEENQEWFKTEEKNIKRIFLEAKKNGKLFMDTGELFGMEGTFKKLNID